MWCCHIRGEQRLKRTICAVLLAFLVMFSSVSVVQSSEFSAQDTTLGFIENVLPFDSKQYNITLESYFKPEFSESKLLPPSNGKQEILTYNLESEDSALSMIFTIENDAVISVHAYVDRGTAICEESYSNLIDAARSLLQRYQKHTSWDSAKMMDMLSELDSVENSTVIKDDLKLTVAHADNSGTFFGDSVTFRWAQTVNGVDYALFAVKFRDGVFSLLGESRGTYTVGDTSVKVSKEEAINIAMNALTNYSYRMSEDWVVTDLKADETNAVAVLQTQTKESNALYPIWSVILPLDGVYPGSVSELLVEVWAGTGEVRYVHHLAYGGAGLSDPDYTLTPESTTPTPTLSDPVTIALIVAALATIVTVTTTLAVKKRNK